MRPLRYSINVTLDGCCDHREGVPDEQLHNHHAANLARADALIFGRVTYQMMEEAWRPTAPGVWPEWMEGWMIPFAEEIDRGKKYVVSSTLKHVDWNAEVIRGDLATAIRRLKEEPGNAIQAGGLTLGRALADLGLIDEYEFVVHPIVAGHGPTLFDGLRRRLELKLVGREELTSGVVSLRYVPLAAER